MRFGDSLRPIRCNGPPRHSPVTFANATAEGFEFIADFGCKTPDLVSGWPANPSVGTGKTKLPAAWVDNPWVISMATPVNKSVVKAIDIMAVVCSYPGSPSLQQIAAEANLSVPTTHRFLVTLKAVGALAQTGGGAYTLGRKLCGLQQRLDGEREETKALIDSELQKIVDCFGVAARLSVLNEEQSIVFVAVANCSKDFRPTARVGEAYEAYATAPGKLLLAELNSSAFHDYIVRYPFIATTDNTITKAKHLIDECAEIRNCGYAVDNCELNEVNLGVAVPVRGLDGSTLAALSVCQARASHSLETMVNLVPVLKLQAQAIARHIEPIRHKFRRMAHSLMTEV